MKLKAAHSLIDPARTLALAEGKTKIIWPDPTNPNKVLIESKDDITAGDGARRDVLKGKGVAATQTTRNVFRLLEKIGVVPTHFVEQLDNRTFRAEKVRMIPIEVVVRGRAFGSYLKRHRKAQSKAILRPAAVEFFYKDDARHDPIMSWDPNRSRFILHMANVPVQDQSCLGEISARSALKTRGGYSATVAAMEAKALLVYRELEKAFVDDAIVIADLKIEFGWTSDGRLVVADVIDNDSWRIWPCGDHDEALDKQRYRDLEIAADDPDPGRQEARAKALEDILANYWKVANMTNRFLK